MNDTTLLRQLLDHLSDAVFFKDAKGRFVRINRVLASWFGLADPAQAIGKSDQDFYPTEFARAISEIEQGILQTGVPILDQEEKFVGRDGKSRWVSTTKVPLRDQKSRITGILGISRDIRSVKRAEEKTRDADAVYRSLIESLPQCIFRKDFEGRYEYVNQRLCDLLGLTTKDFLGKTDFDTNPKALAAKYRRDDQWVMTHEKVFEGVEDFKTKQKRIKIRVVKTPVYDARGRVVGVQGMFMPLDSSSPKKSEGSAR
ncbi:MAG TPA: PAS domain-containing protein [Planctomycetota bacterium]|nr:PAS domain-containing protein [Planctomycetota bacterium]